MDVSVLKGKALSSARCLERYMKYFPSFLLQILPLPSATILGHSPSVLLHSFVVYKERVVEPLHHRVIAAELGAYVSSPSKAIVALFQ